MDLVELQIFKTVAELGGITKAAAALHRVQSNVTTRVQQLEQRLGTKLFHRQGRKLVLSAEGKVLLAYADRLLRLSSEAQAALKGHAPHGLFRLGALESTAATRLPPVLARYHRGYPAVRLELVTGTSGALVDRVLREEIEAAFVAEPFAAKNLETQHAFSEELGLITPKGHPPVGTPRDIGQRIILGFTTGCSYRRRLESWLGRSSVVAERVMEYGSYHPLTARVAAGSRLPGGPEAGRRAIRIETQGAGPPRPAGIPQAPPQRGRRPGHPSVPLDALRKELR